MASIVKSNFSPLRYPGGKGKLCSYIKSVIQANDLFDCDYIEPYAGGAAVAIELLAHEYALSAHINDVSRPIFSFWSSILRSTDDFSRLLVDTKVTVSNWDRQKEIFRHQDEHSDLEVGFATFFLNRTNRSGILNAGIIGGRSQESEWGIDARFNKETLLARIKLVESLKDRIKLTCLDAEELLTTHKKTWTKHTFIYLDPPYYNKGQHLYYNYYEDADHKRIASALGKLKRHNWIVSYDNHTRIRELFKTYDYASYDIGYSAREHKAGSEIMYFSPNLAIPRPSSNMRRFKTQVA